MKLPILSICIPTYNRSACLKECLESILSSAKGHEEQIEVVISDNVSTDDTASVVNEFKERYPWIRYHRNDTNIGAEKNFYAVAGLAAGEYIWIFGDDDKMTDEAIPSVLKRIESGYGLIICNFSRWSRDFSTVLKQRFILINQDEEFDDANLLMKRIGLHLGYITCFITKRSIFLSAPPSEYEPYLESNFPHVYSIYAGIAKNCHAAYISAPILCNRGENSFPDWEKVFITSSSLVFEALLEKGYSQNAVYAAKHRVLKDNILPGNIIVMKAKGDAGLKNVAQLLYPHYKKDWLFWTVCLPVLYVPVPKFLVRLAMAIARAVFPNRFSKEGA